jgi:hypothetical protein
MAMGIESTNLQQHANFRSAAEKERYLAVYMSMAAIGMHSFDCITARKRPTNYFLVARPARPLRIEDVPDDIRQILSMTRLSGKLNELDMVTANDVV